MIGTDVDASQIFTARRPSVVVLGHDSEGRRPRIRAQCDVLTRDSRLGARPRP